MTVRLPLRDIQEGERVLDAASTRYLVRVLRLPEGATFEVFDPSTGVQGHACILHIHTFATVSIAEVRPGEAERPLVWIQGLPKGDKSDQIVQDATELGTTVLFLAEAQRSVVRLDTERRERRVRRWQTIADHAARQSRRLHAPRVTLASWEDAVLSVPESFTRICLYESANVPLRSTLANALRNGEPLALAVGPEGGLSPEEVASAAEAGWLIRSLGPRILRTETVCAAVLGAVAVFSPSEFESP